MATGQDKLIDFGRRSGLKVHPVSMGAMRFPKDDGEAVSLIRASIDAGMIYIDTSRGYVDSELKLAKALKDGYREKVILSTKWSPWILKAEPDDNASAECTYKRIVESMARLEVDKLDFYQVWNVDSKDHYEQATAKGGMLDGIMRAKDEGLIEHTGFTTHDTPENVSEYIDDADWCEVILFTYNILNPTYRDVIAKAHDKGIATIVMNPLGGGMLAEDSLVLKKAVKKALGHEDIIEAAHRYLASSEIVDTISDLVCWELDQILPKIRVDLGWFWEDICGNNGPLITPEIFNNCVVPGYRKISDKLLEYDVTLLAVDCDGLVDAIIPGLLDGGVNIIYPVEIGSWGTDPMKLRKRFGSSLRFIGGIRKEEIRKGKAAIDAEIERRLPLIKEGGYIPTPDHEILPGTLLEDYQYYLEKIRAIRL